MDIWPFVSGHTGHEQTNVAKILPVHTYRESVNKVLY